MILHVICFPTFQFHARMNPWQANRDRDIFYYSANTTMDFHQKWTETWCRIFAWKIANMMSSYPRPTGASMESDLCCKGQSDLVLAWTDLRSVCSGVLVCLHGPFEWASWWWWRWFVLEVGPDGQPMATGWVSGPAGILQSLCNKTRSNKTWGWFDLTSRPLVWGGTIVSIIHFFVPSGIRTRDLTHAI